MPYTIKDGCIACDSCRPLCPNGAIKANDNDKDEENSYWIDPTLCNGCRDLEVPQCVEACDIGSLTPLQAKKGRLKSTLLPAAISDIFLNGKNTPFASSMAMWETCTLLSQRHSLPWQTDAEGYYSYCRAVHRGRGEIRFRIAADPEANSPNPLVAEEAASRIANSDIRAACVHLIFAAYAINCDRPWEDVFVLNDQHIEQYLGLDKRKDLTKLEKLTLIKDLVHQCCQILMTLDWPRQGKVQSFALSEHLVWQLLDTQYFFEDDAEGYQHLIGLSFTVRAGTWSKHFLNKQDYRRQTAFYQYGSLPQSLLSEVMSNWQQHEGAMRLLLWLLFKLRLGGDHRMTVRTLLRIAYGEERLTEAITIRGAHKRLLKTFEGDLETLYYYGLKPRFDPETYPLEIQPLWARVADIPEDADDALEFWANDANRTLSLTDTAPRDKWQRLLNARLLGFEAPDEWQQKAKRSSTNRRRRKSLSQTEAQAGRLSGSTIKAARQRQNLTQRALADLLGKSQSWIRDVEKGRFGVNAVDQALLRQTLNL
ncbi:helix-turn-helix domain-containing protein [Oscillatoria sp. CS-180]|uniref:helix-turn-helix domain-containing protein n=1 Tax=Oscillatoria sp. CS-180 TaxID=3021720 RepID=UPI0023302782|nr:helix-turn-helix domain-containing protein [Oscillatoria sp. CS-180]MDB9527241.1 helix-turn-helix domain-containing protein [Oscillatoria sp. CS-180]